MVFGLEQIISTTAAVITLLLFIFPIDWQYFRDWIAVFLFTALISLLLGSPMVNLDLLEYPVRWLPHYYNTSILFEVWAFPVLSILYNQLTRKCSPGAIILYALLFSAAITAIEYPLELYTQLIRYNTWTWFTTFYTLTFVFLLSRIFIAFFRWGCDHFG